MIKVFVPNTVPSNELMDVIRAVEAAGYDKSQAFVGNDFNHFAAPLLKGDTAVVYSLTAFRSVTELLTAAEQLAGRGVDFHSIQEPWFNESKIATTELLGHLFRLAEQLHRPAPIAHRSSTKTKGGKVLDISARVALAVELRSTKQMSLIEACRTAGCSVSAYYAHTRNK